MADLNYSLTVAEDEIVLLIQLVQAHGMKKVREQDRPDFSPPEAALLKKLLDARNEGIRAARAAGKL